ncbi:hypothetical protein KKF82_06635 [Patescibacteria group bacterium]|nr:hypothetical protein [Patescibacteria group bacterium]
MEKASVKKVMNDFEKWKKLNTGSRSLLKEIKKEINFFIGVFEPKIYPENTIYDRFTYKTRLSNLAKIWAERWLEGIPELVSMITDELIPRIKPTIDCVGLDRELVLSTIETEVIDMFREFVIDYINDIQIYRLMSELEDKLEVFDGKKIERIFDYNPFQFDIISGFVYNVRFEGNDPKINVFSQTKILKFNDLSKITDDEEIKKEIKEKLKEAA